jgi:hypothetical protein
MNSWAEFFEYFDCFPSNPIWVLTKWSECQNLKVESPITSMNEDISIQQDGLECENSWVILNWRFPEEMLSSLWFTMNQMIQFRNAKDHVDFHCIIWPYHRSVNPHSQVHSPPNSKKLASNHRFHFQRFPFHIPNRVNLFLFESSSAMGTHHHSSLEYSSFANSLSHDWWSPFFSEKCPAKVTGLPVSTKNLTQGASKWDPLSAMNRCIDTTHWSCESEFSRENPAGKICRD